MRPCLCGREIGKANISPVCEEEEPPETFQVICMCGRRGPTGAMHDAAVGWDKTYIDALVLLGTMSPQDQMMQLLQVLTACTLPELAKASGSITASREDGDRSVYVVFDEGLQRDVNRVLDTDDDLSIEGLTLLRREMRHLTRLVCEAVGLDPEVANAASISKRLDDLRRAAGWDDSLPRGGPNVDAANHALDHLGYRGLYEMVEAARGE